MELMRFFLIFFIGFVSYYFCDANLFSFLHNEITIFTGSKAIGHIASYLITMLPLIVTIYILHKDFRTILDKLGLSGNFVIGVSFAFLVTLPSLVAYSLMYDLNYNLSINTIIINTISSAFFEEIIYRGFLIGQLYRFTRLGFLPSILLGSSLFGIAHLYQSNDINEMIGIFLITFLGSLLFFWVYSEWKFNLWVAIFLHCFMNLYWLIFNVDTNASGDIYANIFRIFTIILVIFCTLVYKKKKGFPLEINKRTFWIKPQN